MKNFNNFSVSPTIYFPDNNDHWERYMIKPLVFRRRWNGDFSPDAYPRGESYTKGYKYFWFKLWDYKNLRFVDGNGGYGFLAIDCYNN